MNTSPIPVIHLITRLIVGGAQENTLFTAALLPPARYSVLVVNGAQTGREGSLIEEARQQGIRLTILRELVRQVSPLKDLLALIKLYRLLRREPCQVLHTHSSKAGILGLTLNLAFELAPFNIYVNCIVPGPIETPFWDPLSKGMSPETMQAFFAALAKKEVPLGRMGTPDDIAGPALFFASDLSSYVSGQILCVAGGQPGISYVDNTNAVLKYAYYP